MKPLYEYINETLIKNRNSDGLEVIYAMREGIDLKSITEEEFVQMMMEDAKDAYESYKQNHKLIDQILRQREQYIKSQTDRAIRYAEAKWKTEKKRQEYIEKAKELIKKEVDNQWFNRDRGVCFRALTYISNDYPGCADVNAVDLRERDLKSLLNELRRSKWWVGATGWKFTARSWKGDTRCNGLFVEPISNSFSWDEYRKERKESDDAISSWLSDLKYFGD